MLGRLSLIPSAQIAIEPRSPTRRGRWGGEWLEPPPGAHLYSGEACFSAIFLPSPKETPKQGLLLRQERQVWTFAQGGT